MIAYAFDGTQNGLLCCLFDSFTGKEKPFLVTSAPLQLGLDFDVLSVKTDEEKALRVRAGLIKYGRIALLNRLFYVLRSNDDLKETIVFNVAYKCLENRRDETFNYADADVVQFDELYRKISIESHRYLGFVRFESSADGIWYSHVEPDNDVVDLIAPHFLKRFATKFIIHDVKRNVAVLSDGKRLYTRKLLKPLAVFLSPSETEMKELWKTYYQSVNIKERKNVRQMNGYMPRRYHKHLPERNLPGEFFN